MEGQDKTKLSKKVIKHLEYFDKVRKNSYKDIIPIDNFGVDGDFVESQTFAFLAIRSYLNLPITFPETTGIKIPSSGGLIFKN